jgi:hypothetical protein
MNNTLPVVAGKAVSAVDVHQGSRIVSMKARKPTPQQVKQSDEANDNERDFGLVLAMSEHRRQVCQAGKLRAIYSQSHAQNFMTFQQFQKPRERNRVLAEYGLEKIFTPFDPVPAKRREPRRKARHSSGSHR